MASDLVTLQKKRDDKGKASSASLAEDQIAIPAELVKQQLERILGAPAFEATDSQKAFLRFVVEMVLKGQASEIKGYTVATLVFGRGKDFDQASDPVVSIHANKLRRALERYYLLEGQADSVFIDIPKGTYVPTFTQKTRTKAATAAVGATPAIGIENTWPSVMILPFENLTGKADRDFLCIGFASELAVEISRFQGIDILFPTEKQMLTGMSIKCRFILQGSVREEGTGMKITVRLTDKKSGRQIWANTYRSGRKDHNRPAFQERIINVIAASTAGICGAIPKAMAIESRHKSPAELTTYEAILRYYEYDHKANLENFPGVLESLSHAAAKEPDCGLVWTALAHMYTGIYGLALPGFDAPLEKAIKYAERGAQIDPDSQRALAMLALTHFHGNELTAAAKEAEHALELNPNSLLFMDGLGYIMTLSGRWETGPALIRTAIRRNPLYRSVAHYPLWLDCLRRQDFEGAYLETMGLKESGIFWYPLAKAAALGRLGRVEEAERYLKKLLTLRPDFPANARMLVSRYIKFDELIECVMAGLRKAGLNESVQNDPNQ